ncbi:hypothetical protein FH972_002077 [Carpinus fangiana]|uniref:Uncharacterized protein n=1 Tax=Carpinus fangiana TaxID=176857 RepID=A0A5N6QFL6_9ROSI|nr:hypothetical protein FH972_002077 [Carpinus fangiana]
MEHGKIQSNHQTPRQRQMDVRGRVLMEEAKRWCIQGDDKFATMDYERKEFTPWKVKATIQCKWDFWKPVEPGKGRSIPKGLWCEIRKRIDIPN